MNNIRRRAICAIAQTIAELENDLQELLDQEQEYFGNMPESIQSGSKGDDAQAAIDSMESAVNYLQDAAELAREAAGS